MGKLKKKGGGQLKSVCKKSDKDQMTVNQSFPSGVNFDPQPVLFPKTIHCLLK